MFYTACCEQGDINGIFVLPFRDTIINNETILINRVQGAAGNRIITSIPGKTMIEKQI